MVGMLIYDAYWCRPSAERRKVVIPGNHASWCEGAAVPMRSRKFLPVDLVVGLRLGQGMIVFSANRNLNGMCHQLVSFLRHRKKYCQLCVPEQGILPSSMARVEKACFTEYSANISPSTHEIENQKSKRRSVLAPQITG
jgi:hypothetical protein